MLMGAALVVAALTLTSGVAYAAGADVEVATADNFVTVPMVVITVLSGLIIPIVHGLITKANANGPVAVIVGLLLSAVAGVIGTATQLDGVAVISWTTIGTAAMAWVAQVAAYRNIFKPLGNPQKVLPETGLG